MAENYLQITGQPPNPEVAVPDASIGISHSMTKPGVTFADYQETKPRHFHAILDEWLAR